MPNPVWHVVRIRLLGHSASRLSPALAGSSFTYAEHPGNLIPMIWYLSLSSKNQVDTSEQRGGGTCQSEVKKNELLGSDTNFATALSAVPCRQPKAGRIWALTPKTHERRRVPPPGCGATRCVAFGPHTVGSKSVAALTLVFQENHDRRIVAKGHVKSEPGTGL